MADLSLASRILGYALLGITGLYAVLLWFFQIRVLLGGTFHNPDGSVDDWHQQEVIYGIAFADVFLSCPVAVAGVVLALVGSRWGFSLVAMVSFWAVWANLMTTATSLRFHHPRITAAWLLAYPFGSVVGLAYLLWSAASFEALYSS